MGARVCLPLAVRRTVCILTALALWGMLCARFGYAGPEDAQAEPLVYANAYIVMDADTGQVVLQRAPDDTHFPASITKIMTLALALALRPSDPAAQVTVSEAAILAVGPGSSMISLQPGEVVRVSDLLYATMLASANDAANVLGEYAAGSLQEFVRQMNDKAQALGMTGTHFSNPSGYHSENHYTTARDMALLLRWALTVPGFTELFGAQEYTMPATNLSPYPRTFTTDNALLLPGPLHHDGIIGGKSGWTPEANYTMTEAVRQDGHTLIAVVLDCPRRGERCADCARLLRFCADRFHSVPFDASAFALSSIEVLQDGVRLGDVPLTAPSGRVLLPMEYSMEQVRLETDIPSVYEAGTPFAASAALINDVTGETLCILPVEMDEELLAQLLAGAASRTAVQWTRADGIKAAVGCAALSLLALLLNWGAARSDALRRRAGRRAIQQLRDRLAGLREPPEPQGAPPLDPATFEKVDETFSQF